MSDTVLCSAEKLDIKKTFDCGQCFRWNADRNGVYFGVASGYPARIWNDGGNVMLDSPAAVSFWNDYLDLNSEYEKHCSGWRDYQYLEECMDFSMGIRILNQEPWEALCSFIISQCNNIARIKGIVERLCTEYGEKKDFKGITYSTFPSADRIAELEPEDLSMLRSGYRAPYIISAARSVSSGMINLEELKKIPYEDAKKQLLSLNGIGEKVANCAVLFGLHHMEAFPVDVWMKRALKEHFPTDFRPEELGDYAGLAQQYIFYCTRERGRK